MTIPVSINSDKYYEHLREFRDSALEASNWYGKRRNIGGLVFGNAVAGWRAQDGGIADLEDAGVRFRRTNLIRQMPTTLRTLNRVGNGHEITTYKMDLDEIGFIEVYINMFHKGGILEVIRAGLSRNTEIQMGLNHPTDADRELIYTEMHRGATGWFQTSRTH